MPSANVGRLWLALLVAGACALSLTSCKGSPGDDDKITVGAVLPLTGDNSLYGENERKGFTVALQEISKRWPNVKIEVVYEDTMGEAKTAASAIQKLKMQGVKYIIDDAMSSVTFAMVPSLGPDAIMISTGATNPKLSGCSPFFFRIWNSDAEEGSQAAHLSQTVHPGTKKIAVVYVNNDYGTGLRDVYVRDVEKVITGLTVRDFSYEASQTNFRDLSAIVRGFNPDLIYLVGYGPQTGLVVKEVRGYGIKATIISTVTTEDPKFLERAGAAAEGTIYLYPNTPSGSEADTFRNLFVKTYNSQPGILADHGYDAIFLYAMAFNSGAKTPTDVQHWFHNMPPYDGASGVIKFDANGDVHEPYVMKSVQKGAFAPYHE
jgi:branched-chain amino acid transport system substrate-binding protein